MSEDLDQIMAVMDAAFEPAWGEAWNRRQVSDSLAFPHTRYRLISDNESHSAAGFTLVRAAPGEEELLLIAVAPEHRGRGLGKQLLEQVLEDARGRGAERVFLEMRFNNPAVELYQKMGFVPIGRRKDYYRLPDGSRIDAITFACQL
jgi:ribosomal-protein-alanine N-acetyltransferase